MKSWKGNAFISIILTLILLVVALSTATFAWFSANNVVNVSTISFVAETREGESLGDLQIAWTSEVETDSYLIDFAQPNDSGIDLKPIMPITAPVIGSTNCVNEFNEDIFATGFTSSTQEIGYYMYDGFYYDDDDEISPYKCIGTEEDQDSFYIINTNESFAQRLTIEYTIEGDLADKLCLAIFVEDTLQYVLSESDNIYYGIIEQNTEVDDTRYVDNLVSVSNNNTSVIVPANSSIRMTMYAWYNGVTMTDSDVEKSSTLSILKFKGSYLSTAS
jgi:hypothetical protein